MIYLCISQYCYFYIVLQVFILMVWFRIHVQSCLFHFLFFLMVHEILHIFQRNIYFLLNQTHMHIFFENTNVELICDPLDSNGFQLLMSPTMKLMFGSIILIGHDDLINILINVILQIRKLR